MRRSAIVDATARLVFHSALVLSVYLLAAGHNRPGGGFIGGLVAGTAFAVYYVAGGVDDVRAAARVRPWGVLAAGLMVAASTALVPLVFGGEILEGDYLDLDLPVFGALKVTSALVFDTGVYGVVVGLVLMVFEGFGEEPRPEEPAA